MRYFFVIAAALCAFGAGPAFADGSWFDNVGKSLGLTPPEPNTPDYIKASRPKTPMATIPAFATPEEPPSKVKSADELKAMDEDLQNSSQRLRPTADAGAAQPVKKSKHSRKP